MWEYGLLFLLYGLYRGWVAVDVSGADGDFSGTRVAASYLLAPAMGYTIIWWSILWLAAG